MTKDQFKRYINEAVDAMEQAELDFLFPASQQPDLYTLVSEFTGLKGEIKKLAQSSLKTNSEFQSAIVQNNDRWEELRALIEEKESEKEDSINKDLKNILFQLIDQDELLTDTHHHFQHLDNPHWTRLQDYKKQLASWQKGFDITMTRWRKFMKATGLYQTGTPGQVFDPQFHEAVAVEHHPGKQNNQILKTEMPGYLFRNQLIRQAKVIVNKSDPNESIPGILSPAKRKEKTGKKRQKRRNK